MNHDRYCSPLVDPYQPAEAAEEMMPRLLDALIDRPPRVLAVQTRGSLILRDLDHLCTLSRKTKLRISFSLTTNRDDVRRLYEPLCEPIEQRVETIWCLRDAGLEVYATLAPLLPCDPEDLAAMAIQATGRDLIGDPFHVRAVKKRGATTRQAALRISEHRGYGDWHDPEFQQQIVDRIHHAAERAGRRFAIGPEAFRWLTS